MATKSKKTTRKKPAAKKGFLNKLKSLKPKQQKTALLVLIVFAVSMVGYFGFVRSSADAFTEYYKIGVRTELGCKLAGRVWKPNTQDCKDKCRHPQAVLKFTTNPVRGYCDGYVTVQMNAVECVNTLHRYFINDIGCSKRANQENTNDSPQCIPGYPNYRAEGNTDKCIANVIPDAPTGGGAGQVGPPPVTPSGNNNPAPTTVPSGDTSSEGTSDTPDESEEDTYEIEEGTDDVPVPNEDGSDGGQVEVDEDVIVASSDSEVSIDGVKGIQQAVQVDSWLTQAECHLRGRSWVPADKRIDFKGGCSRQECFLKNVKVRSNKGAEYCEGYVNRKMSETKCDQLKRKWLKDVEGCATRPNQNRTKPVLDATQCLPKYPVYVFHTKDQGNDECITRSTLQYMQSVANRTGRSIAKLTSLPMQQVCKLQKMVLRDGKCKPRVIPSVGASNEGVTTNTGGKAVVHPTKDECSSKGRKWVGKKCAHSAKAVPAGKAGKLCRNAAQAYVKGSPYDYCANSSVTEPTASQTTPSPGSFENPIRQDSCAAMMYISTRVRCTNGYEAGVALCRTGLKDYRILSPNNGLVYIGPACYLTAA